MRLSSPTSAESVAFGPTREDVLDRLVDIRRAIGSRSPVSYNRLPTHALLVTVDRGKHRRNPSLQGRCADRERWCRRAVERRHASYLGPMNISAFGVHGHLAEQGRHSASLLCRRACTMLLSEERIRQQGKLRWLCPLHTRPCCGELAGHRPATTRPAPTSSHLPTLQAAEGRVRCTSVQLQTLEKGVRVT